MLVGVWRPNESKLKNVYATHINTKKTKRTYVSDRMRTVMSTLRHTRAFDDGCEPAVKSERPRARPTPPTTKYALL